MHAYRHAKIARRGAGIAAGGSIQPAKAATLNQFHQSNAHRAPIAHPMTHLLGGIGLAGIDRADRCKPIREPRGAIADVAAVKAIDRSALHQHGLIDAGRVHLAGETLDGHRIFEIRVVDHAAGRRRRVARCIARNKVRVAIDHRAAATTGCAARIARFVMNSAFSAAPPR